MRSSLSENTNASEKQSNSKETEEVPIELRDLMQLACLVKRVPGDGACLFTSGCLWIKGSKEKNKVENFRKESHRFIVKHLDYYRGFFKMPFIEQVGVGRSSFEKTINTYEEMKTFLLSDSSLYLFSNSSLDLTNLANMYDMKIAIFTYSSGGSVVLYWTWICPDPK